MAASVFRALQGLRQLSFFGCRVQNPVGSGRKASVIESVQDFLIKLDIKPLTHLLEISTFSLSNVIVRLTKIMNRADKNF